MVGARRRAALVAALAVFAALVAACGVEAQMPGMGVPGKKQPPARREDVPLVRCAVCELLAKHVHRQAAAKREAATKAKPFKEMDAIELVEQACDPKKEAGEWITKLDLVEEGDVLAVKEMEDVGECGTECRTAAKACTDVLGDHDVDLAEAVYNDELNRAKLTQRLCRKLTKACTKPAPKMPNGRAPGEPFKKMDPKKLEMEKLMRQMQANMPEGMPGMSMYGRDELMGMGAGGDEDYDEDYDSPYDVDIGLDDVVKSAKPPQDFAGRVRSAVDTAVDTVSGALNRASDAVAEGVGKAIGWAERAFGAAPSAGGEL